MDQEKVKNLTTVGLRFVGVIIIFVGLIVTTMVLSQAIAATSNFLQDLPPGMSVEIKSAFGRMSYWAAFNYLTIVAWGWLLIRFARPIASGITRW